MTHHSKSFATTTKALDCSGKRKDTKNERRTHTVREENELKAINSKTVPTRESHSQKYVFVLLLLLLCILSLFIALAVEYHSHLNAYKEKQNKYSGGAS